MRGGEGRGRGLEEGRGEGACGEDAARLTWAGVGAAGCGQRRRAATQCPETRTSWRRVRTSRHSPRRGMRRVQLRPLGAPAAPGAAMAPAFWPCLSHILWLACLLPLAPARVAAGKALRGLAAPPAAARRGAQGRRRRATQPEPGLPGWRCAPCALRALPPPPRPLQHAARGARQPAPRSPVLSPFIPLPRSRPGT